MTGKFKGFPDDLFLFLADLAANNNRSWFNDNKARYQQNIVEPMQEFIIAMGERLPSISQYFVADPRTIGGSMFRIYRDIRYTKDKRPYKENVGCMFRHVAGKDAHAPGFYLHLEPGNIFAGGGIWLPPNTIVNRIRTQIVEAPRAWERIITDRRILQTGGISGEGLKRPPRGYDPDHRFIDDLKRKSFYVMQEFDQSIVSTSKFIDQVEASFKTASPLMRFVTHAMELPYTD